MDDLFAWFEAGALRPQVTEVYPLARAGEALQRLEDRKAKGRIALVTDLELNSHDRIE
jgi:NADPH2:quinone reductase